MRPKLAAVAFTLLVASPLASAQLFPDGTVFVGTIGFIQGRTCRTEVGAVYSLTPNSTTWRLSFNQVGHSVYGIGMDATNTTVLTAGQADDTCSNPRKHGLISRAGAAIWTTPPWHEEVRDFEFEDDGTVIAVGPSGVYASTTTLSVLYTANVTGVAIDRELGATEYVMSSGIGLFRADRQGLRATIRVGNYTDVALWAETGQYVAGGPTGVAVIDRDGLNARPIPTGPCIGLTVLPNATAWTWTSDGDNILELDLRARTIKSSRPGPAPQSSYETAMGIYGTNRLVCTGSGAPGTKVDVALQSRRAGDGGQPYAIACSFGRRPGVAFPNGEYLALNTTDTLFAVSSRGLAPSVFRGFRGVTDATGNASAEVFIPSTLAANLGVTVFVAGIVYDGGGIRTVTNTHWFVL